MYIESFPDYERRRISSHALACEDPAFHPCIAVENGSLLALLFYWTYDDKIYIEHIAVNQQMRGQKIGSRLLEEFTAQNSGKTVVLEIDPPVDDISRRRLGFYERAGFINTGRIFTHPSYTKNGQGHQLLVLSYPDEIAGEDYERFMEFVTEKVLKYVD